MTQLVGSPCVRCQRTINSILEGKFCPDCGNAVHNGCMASVPDAPQRCWTCGGERANPQAAEVRRERQAAAQTASMAAGESYPISRVCPQCGSGAFRQVRPAGLVAFTLDRVCTSCGTRYTPVTPVWGAVAMIVTGLLLILFGIVGALFSLAAHDFGGLVCEAVLGAFGGLAIVQGVRSQVRSTKR